MSIVRNFNLYLNAGNGSAPYINVNQYDQGEQWIFTLYKEDGTKYLPSTGAIVGIKADNRGIINTGTVDAEGRVVINETQQMTAAAGIAIFELLIDGDSHGTANFLVNVEQRPGDNADLSDSDLSLIQQAVDSAEVIVEVIGDGDPSEVIGEHVDAWLDNHPEATTTVEDGAITAPKINSTLWDKLLVSKEASGVVASFDDGADDVPVSSLKVALEPVQTGTGDPSPTNIRPIYPANGKNLLPITLANLQTNNTAGTWNGNEYTYRGVTYTVNTNGGGGVISITANGTATYESSLVLVTNINALLTVGETYTMTGCPSGGASGTYCCSVGTSLTNGRILTDYGSGATVTYTSQYDQTTRNAYVGVAQYYTATNVTFMPQIERGSSASSYQPYQSVMVERKGRNLYPIAIGRDAFANNAGGTHSTDSDTLTVTCTTGTSSGVYTTTWSTLRKLSEDKIGQTVTYSFDIKSSVNTNILVGYERTGYTTKAVTTEWQRITLTGTFNTASSFVCYGKGTACTIQIKNFMLEYGSEAHNYEPYSGSTYYMQIGQNVYGGTVDLATGVLTVDKGIVTLDGTENWGKSGNEYYTVKNDMLRASDYIGLITCDKLKTVRRHAVATDDYYITGYVSSSYEGQNWIYAKIDSTVTTAAECKTWFTNNPTTVVYPLATPNTIQLTPQEVKTLLGYNNISSSGTVDVIYHADTKLYVDKMTAVDNAIIAPTEVDFVATRNYTVNDLVIVNDTLYKCTANIASGSAITPNSNVTQTTLSALIKALS